MHKTITAAVIVCACGGAALAQTPYELRAMQYQQDIGRQYQIEDLRSEMQRQRRAAEWDTFSRDMDRSMSSGMEQFR